MFQSKLPDLSVSIFSQMSALANQYGALNLSQGFPEFDTPESLKCAINQAINEGKNQYAPSPGLPVLLSAISGLIKHRYQVEVDGASQITVTSGATEALFVAIQTLVRSGDEVIVFDPAYDSYEPSVQLAGGRCRHIPLSAPDYRVNWQQVEQSINDNTRLIIINTPHNPTGTMLSAGDMAQLTRLVCEHNLYVISDEVYEHIVFDQQTHHSALKFPQLAERAFVVSSFGKTFHCTGWKMGYCVAPPALTTEFRKIHQYVTFSSFTPAQFAIAENLLTNPTHVDDLGRFYQAKRDLFSKALTKSRFKQITSAGTYFLLLDFSAISDKSDVEFCQWLVEHQGVAAIPLSVFNESGKDDRIIRLCFAKNDDTLIAAAEKLCQL